MTRRSHSESDDLYSNEEVSRRFEAAFRSARIVGRKPQSEMKLGKARNRLPPNLKKRARPDR